MSKRVDLELLSDDDKNKIDTELYMEIKPVKKWGQKFGAKNEHLQVYRFDDKFAYVPMGYEPTKFKPTSREQFTKVSYTFSGELREKQKEAKTEIIDKLNKTGQFILAAGTGFGKSITSIYMLSVIQHKTLIIANRIVLLKQWKKELEQFLVNPKIKILTTKNFEKDDADIYIVNAMNIEKFPKDFFSDIGFVIVDEIHMIMSKLLSSCLQYIYPRYIFGLSATPYRIDGLNFLFDLYFGKNKLFIPLKQTHYVYKFNTEITPDTLTYQTDGTLSWDSMLSFQSTNKERNELIVKCAKYFKERKILILTKRTEHAIYLFNRLVEEKQEVTTLIQSQTEFNQSARILIGNTAKLGTGFNHPDLDMLIIATDIDNYFIQYLGRVFRRQDVNPIILDFIDNHPTLKKHSKNRDKVYEQANGVMCDIKKDHPELFV